ncbi:MAG: phosphoenolpyruvate--protein phosphotransferase [Candidatus Omnitrophica bacterium]|nr:phosphoenolpyruvate--protein phosphotransferase [Candidatus Omnitrophota bacterium]
MKRDHSKLICDIGELTTLFTDTSNLDTLLQKIVEMISLHMEAEVCSIYLFYEDTAELVLRATKGLYKDSIGKVKLALGEGLTGLALSELRPVCEGDASKHPNFRYFSGIGEEKYCSFMAVPILRGQTRIGVMTLQSEKKNYFTPDDITVFRAITSQLANTIEMAKLLISLENPAVKETRFTPAVQLKFIKGLVGAEGFAFGEALVLSAPSLDDIDLSESSKALTLSDFHRAIREAERQLEDMQHKIETKLFDVASLIFSAQILMLKDHALIGAMEALVKAGDRPEKAVKKVITEYVSRFDRMSNEFLREKRFDVIDLGRRILENLIGVCDRHEHYDGKIVVARELLPSDALKLSSQNVAGIVLLSGGVTSHVSVLARSLNIPLVIANDTRLLDLKEGVQVLLDGAMGNVYIAPDKDVVAKFREKEALKAGIAQVKNKLLDKTHTKDGVRVTLLANINLLGDIAVAREYKAEGIGLYRSEFPFIVRSDFPTEEEQYVIYRRLVETTKGHEITFRTLDIGGDKMLAYYNYSKEANPFLGLRSIRFSLKHKDIFIQQIRAILRASFDTEVRMMFPMISSVDEFYTAKMIVMDCLHDLKSQGLAHQRAPLIGAMIELPSAVELIEELATEAGFFSIGTNDLIQYILAIDRTNEKVADLYVPHHPAVLRALKRIVDAAKKYKRDISVCGDMAHDVKYLSFLIGIGIRKLSLDARYLPKVQEKITGLDSREAAQQAGEALKERSISGAARFFS